MFLMSVNGQDSHCWCYGIYHWIQRRTVPTPEATEEEGTELEDSICNIKPLKGLSQWRSMPMLTRDSHDLLPHGIRAAVLMSFFLDGSKRLHAWNMPTKGWTITFGVVQKQRIRAGPIFPRIGALGYSGRIKATSYLESKVVKFKFKFYREAPKICEN